MPKKSSFKTAMLLLHIKQFAVWLSASTKKYFSPHFLLNMQHSVSTFLFLVAIETVCLLDQTKDVLLHL